MPFCEYCGIQQSGTAKFCRKCGKPVRATDSNTSSSINNSGTTAKVSQNSLPPEILSPEFQVATTPTVPQNIQPRQEKQKRDIATNGNSSKRTVGVILLIVLCAALFVGSWQYYSNNSSKDGSTSSNPAIANKNVAPSNSQKPTIKDTPAFAKQLSANVGQAIVVQDRQNGFSAQIELWAKENDSWQKLREFQAVIGKNGFAPIGEKREGDNRTPSGTYKLGTTFGYQASIDSKMSYRQLTENDYWVDDPSSSQYNTWVYGVPSARSYERLRRTDSMHKFGIVISYNINPVVAGNGSSIFLHVWRSPGTGTAGGIALAEDDIVQVLRLLDPAKDPTIILNFKG